MKLKCMQNLELKFEISYWITKFCHANTVIFRKLPYESNEVLLFENHPHSPLGTFLWLLSLLLFTLCYFFLYNYTVSLHDVSHYIVAGVNQIRDHKELIYPYSSNDLGVSGHSYSDFQDNNINFNIRTSYPSKLYSMLYGLVFSFTGGMTFYSAQWLTFGALFLSNVFLYLIGSRFFKGISLLFFIASVVFLPVMRFTLNPGSDVFGYLTCLFLIWMSICLRVNLFFVGLTAGILCQFRTQSFAILIAIPFLINVLFAKISMMKSFMRIFLGFLVSYVAFGFFYKNLFVPAEGFNQATFYINQFSASFYRISDFKLIFQKFSENLINIFDKTQLFFIGYTAIIGLGLPKFKVQRGFVIAGLIYIAVPFVIYTFDRTAPPSARYYMPAVPLLLLACYVVFNNLGALKYIRANIFICISTILIVLSWQNVHGFPLSHLAAFNTINGRLHFQDFQGAEKALKDYFDDDDFIIINHSLPTGLSKIHNVIYVPSYETFKYGDNRAINGLIFVYSSSPPNDFFMPKDWMANGTLPNEIKDEYGVTFKKVFVASSDIPNFVGGIESSTFFYVYKNLNADNLKTYDSNKNRIYHAENGISFNRLKSIDPNINDSKAWGRATKDPEINNGVVVGPGPSNSNILVQPFSANYGDDFLIKAKASSNDNYHTQGRLQVNWLDSSGQYISSSLRVINVDRDIREYSFYIKAPPNAKTGWIAISPHGKNDIVRFYEMKVMGR